MNRQQLAAIETSSQSDGLLLGTGLTFASLILVPALAATVGLGPSFTGALRIALMKASSRAIGKRNGGGGESDTGGFSCH